MMRLGACNSWPGWESYAQIVIRIDGPALAASGAVALLSVGVAEAASCSKLGGIRSQTSKTPVKVTFVNKSGEYRSVMWIDFKGQPVSYANLNPGERYTISTYVTHPWMFTDGPGNCVEMFMPRKGVSSFNLTAKSTGAGGD